jgi:hypothetical protein
MITRENAEILQQLIQSIDPDSRRLNISTHQLSNGNVVAFRTSKPFDRGTYTEYFYGIQRRLLERQDLESFFILFVCDSIEEIIVFPAKELSDLLYGVEPSGAGDYKVHIYVDDDSYEIFVTGKPRTNVSCFLNNFDVLASAVDEFGNLSNFEQVLPEEVTEPARLYEGAVRQILINAYERNPEARRRCIAHYGPRCIVCNFDFGKTYGKQGQGYIHVHHLRNLSEISKTYEVNPITDLRPVCPNCHAMIHRRVPAYSIDDVKTMLKKAQAQHAGA